MTEKVRIGTMSFSKEGWPGSFYPKGVKPAGYLEYYATQFNTVEIDSTFYRVPSASVVQDWYESTPKGFTFAAKLPQEITHWKGLQDCGDELKVFLRAMSGLREKLGPLLIQLPHLGKKSFPTLEDFLERLAGFLKLLPKTKRFAVEVRNENFLEKPLADLLRKYGVALALVDMPWTPRPKTFGKKFDPITADFTYIRWIGDRKAMEATVKKFDKPAVDRSKDLKEWVTAVRSFDLRGVTIFGYASNYYAGHAPHSARLLLELLNKER